MGFTPSPPAKGHVMPAIITHHLFGEDASRRMPAEITFNEEELLAFLLANQGPDPYYFCFSAPPTAIQACHAFAARMHDEHVVDALLVARESVAHLPQEDQGLGKAFVLGLLAHYLLDSEAHAFIQVQENAICNADADLADAHDQVHALIESELDTWMLWSARQQTIADTPAHADLTRTKRVSRVGGTILSQVAWQVFGMTINPERYEGCLRDYEMVYRAIDPTGNPRGRMIAGAEQLGTRYSLLDALSHAAEAGENCPSANLDCHAWVDPATGEVRMDSFPDVFYNSLDKWTELADTLVGGDRAALTAALRRRYDGMALA